MNIPKTFDDYLLSRGYFTGPDEDGVTVWYYNTDDGRKRLSGDQLDGEQDDYNALIAPIAVGQQVSVNGHLFYWFPSGQNWEHNPGIPTNALYRFAGHIALSDADNGGKDIPEGWLVDKDKFEAVHPGDNELMEFIQAAGMAFGAGAALSYITSGSLFTSAASEAGSIEPVSAFNESAGLDLNAPGVSDAGFLDESAGLDMGSPDFGPPSMPDVSRIPTPPGSTPPSIPGGSSILTKAAGAAGSTIIKAITSTNQPGALPLPYTPGTPVVSPPDLGQTISQYALPIGLAFFVLLLLKRKGS